EFGRLVRATSAMATQMMTYAPPSPGLSVNCERRSDRSVPSYSVAALWWGAEAIRVAEPTGRASANGGGRTPAAIDRSLTKVNRTKPHNSPLPAALVSRGVGGENVASRR